jgi:hypothetical protein
MIVASLLLIPVAVLFLALGFINGSSNLLIASIVVSLLVSAALILGARQAAARRGHPKAASEDPGPMPQAPVHEQRPEPETPQYSNAAGYSDSAGYSESAAYSESAHYSESAQYARDEDSYAGNSAPSGTAFAAESGFADQAGAAAPADDLRDADDARIAGRRDTDGHFAAERADYADSDSDPDYGHAASTIDAARAPESERTSWRRPAEADMAVEHDHPIRDDRPVADDDLADQADEFGEPDDDDPDDEPLPQSVRPADAALVSRLDAEVLVVDGRPRYHLADCPHLVGRLTEPLPANEAVELGFSPCGLCRPVDRLVAAVTQS